MCFASASWNVLLKDLYVLGYGNQEKSSAVPSQPEFYPSRNNAATEEEEREGGSKPNQLDMAKVAARRRRMGREKRESRREEDGCEAQGQENSGPPQLLYLSPPLFIITRLHIIEGAACFCHAAHVIPGPLNHSSIDKTNMTEPANLAGVLCGLPSSLSFFLGAADEKVKSSRN